MLPALEACRLNVPRHGGLGLNAPSSGKVQANVGRGAVRAAQGRQEPHGPRA